MKYRVRKLTWPQGVNWGRWTAENGRDFAFFRTWREAITYAISPNPAKTQIIGGH